MGDLRIDAPRAAAGQLDSIQLLRAVAALAVVAHHTPLFANGAWGVDLFFVVSGFIICYVTAESGSQFLRKRVIRVVPLYWLGTLGVFTLALLWPQLLNRSTASVEQLVMSLFFIPFEKGGVVQPMLFLGWTLNYEMFFYLLFALSMQISHRYRAAICAGLLLALVVIGRVVPVDGVIPRFYTSTLLLEFVFGMLCYALYAQAAWRTSVDRSTPLRAILLVSGVGCVILLPLVRPWVDEFGPERGWAWGLPAALAFLLIVIGLSGLRLPRLAVLIGDASFSLYLFHPYLIYLFDRVFGVLASPTVTGYSASLLVIGLCVLAGVLCYRWLEAPITTALRRRFVRSRAVQARGAIS